MKNLIIENHNNLTELQRAEQQSEVEARPPRSPEFPSRQAAEASRDDQQLPLHTDGNNVAYDNPTQTSSASSSETDKDDTESDAVVDGLRRTSSQGPRGDPNATLSHSDARVTEGDLKPAVQPSLAYKSTSGSETHRASSLLLQMIPYRPRAPGAYPTHPHLLTGAGPGVARQATDPKPMMEEVTNSVRLLLDKWTTSGSTPVSDVLVETASKDNPIW